MGLRFKEATEYDWYQVTIRAPHWEIEEALEPMGAKEHRDGPGRLGYERSRIGLDDHGEAMWTVLYGGQNPDPNVFATGDHAQHFSGITKEAFPHHLCTRLDIAQDYAEPGLFDKLLPEFLESANRAGAKTPCAGVWHSEETSRTIYAGSPSSRVRLRMYEKGEEIRAKFGRFMDLSDLPSGWVRLEVQIRPTGLVSRKFITEVPPADLWGVSPTAARIREKVTGVKPPRVSVQPSNRPKPIEQKYLSAINQYGDVFARMVSDLGPDVFAAKFLRDIASRK